MAVTHLSGLQVIPKTYDINDLRAGNFFGFPQVSQDDIDSIPEENLRAGIVVYNTTYNVYMAYMENRWNNVNTSLTYKGEGQEIGSPLAIPYGPRSVIELPESGNSDPGAIYYDSENDVARIYINGAWQNVESAGGDGNFDNIDVTDTASVEHLVAADVSTGIVTTLDINASNNILTNTLEVAVFGQIRTLDVDTILSTDRIDVATTANFANGSTVTFTNGSNTTFEVGSDLTIEGLFNVTNGMHFEPTGTVFFDGGANAHFSGGSATIFEPASSLTIQTTTSISDLRIGTKIGNSVTSGTLSGVAVPVSAIIITTGTAAGVNAQGSFEGSNISGIFSLETGTGCTGTGIATFTLPNTVWQQYSNVFGVTFTPFNTLTYTDASAAKVTFGWSSSATSGNAATVVMTSGGGTQLQDSTTYRWNYIIIGNVSPSAF